MAHGFPIVRLPAVGTLLSLFLLALLLPSSAAQAPPELPPTDPSDSSHFGVVLQMDNAMLNVPYNGGISTRFRVWDTSEDGGRTAVTPGQTAQTHIVDLTVVNERELAEAGWLALIGASSLSMTGGMKEDVPFSVYTTPLISQQEVEIIIVANLTDAETGVRKNATLVVSAQVLPYDRALVQLVDPKPRNAAQFDVATFEVRVRNEAVYPATFQITATSQKEGFLAFAPPSLHVPAMSERTFNLSVRTPYGKFYEFGDTAAINIRVASIYAGTSPGSAVYTTTAVVRVEGFYISSYWMPLLLVGAVSAGVVWRDQRQRRELRRLEKGKPRRVQPTPRQTVLLAELKRTDPEAYKQHKARMDALYAARRARYKQERKNIEKADAEERKQAKLEYAAAMARKKEETKAAKKQAKLDAKAAKKQAKLDKKAAKKQAKIDKKERKRLEKELGQKRKLLEKARKKADKIAAKEAKAQAKAEAKAAKETAKAAKKAKRGRGKA